MSSTTLPDPTPPSPPPTLTLTSGASYPPSLAHLALPLPTLLTTFAQQHPSASPSPSSPSSSPLPPPDHLAVGAYIFTPLPHPKLLLLRRHPNEPSFPLGWEIPGGGAEPPPVDETYLDAVPREVFEETGLRVTRILGAAKGPRGEACQAFEGMRVDPGTGRRRGWRKWNFFVEVEGVGGEEGKGERGGGLEGVKVVLAELEHSEWRWVGREELPGVSFTAQQMREWVGAAFDQWEAEVGVGVGVAV